MENQEQTVEELSRRQDELADRIRKVESKYFGNGFMGDRTKVAILWHVYPVIAGLVGTAVGAVMMKLVFNT